MNDTNQLAALGTAKILHARLTAATVRAGILTDRLAEAMAIADAAARADKLAPLLDELEAIARKAEAL